MSISTTIKTIQDEMRKDPGVDGDAQRISQLGWMLFLKIFDDREKQFELTKKGYRSPIPERLRWRNWAADPEGITGETLLKFINTDLFDTLKSLPAEAGSIGSGLLIRRVFEDSYNYMKNGTQIRKVINKINEIDFNKSEDRHLFGEIYEKILKDLQSAGNAGEYYTPRAVTQFMVDMVDPKLGELILDPACGTGGFLACAIENIRKDVHSTKDETLLQNSILGVEKKQMPHLLCVTNMMLHDIDIPIQIRHDNTLARPLKDYSAADRVDVVVTNPPFGGIEEDGIELNFPATYKTRETAELFLILIIHLLKDGGRAAIILPDGTPMSGDGVYQRVREKLISECNLHTIIRLPKGVFAPYTPTKTNLLFFEKGKPTNVIWYYEHTYPKGYKSYSKTKPIRIEEFAAEKSWWTNRTENKHAWRVPIENVISNGFNLDIINPNSPKDDYDNPIEVLQQFEKVNNETINQCDILKQELMNSLGNLNSIGSISTDLLSQYFTTLVTAPEGISRLRELILHLAVQGRFDTQDPKDESAEILFEKIKSEKKQLVKVGEIKKENLLLHNQLVEIPYSIPHNWKWTSIADVFLDIHSGGTPSKNNPQFWNGEIFWASVKDLKNGKYLESTQDKITQLGLDDCRSKLFSPGNLIICVRMGLGKIAINKIPLAINQDLKVARLSKNVSIDFFYYFYRSQTVSGNAGMTVEGIRQEKLLGIPFPLPPLAEQHRIVAKVDALMQLCDALESRLNERAAVQGRFAKAVGKQVAT